MSGVILKADCPKCRSAHSAMRAMFGGTTPDVFWCPVLAFEFTADGNILSERESRQIRQRRNVQKVLFNACVVDYERGNLSPFTTTPTSR